MHVFLQKAFDIIFPPSDELLLVRRLTTENVVGLLSQRTVGHTLALSDYGDSRIRALIHEAKFHANEKALRLLGSLFAAHIASLPVRNTALVIPIPLSPARERERGYNQVTEILKYALRELPEYTLNTGSLRRKKNTRPQTELGKSERLQNVADAFQVKNPETIRGAHILLVDDVVTTGATMESARETLLPYAKSVTCIALAH